MARQMTVGVYGVGLHHSLPIPEREIEAEEVLELVTPFLPTGTGRGVLLALYVQRYTLDTDYPADWLRTEWFV